MNKHILLIVGVAIVGLVQATSTGLTLTYSSLVEAGIDKLNSRDHICIKCGHLPQQPELRDYFQHI
jgi:hypothetical protein